MLAVVIVTPPGLSLPSEKWESRSYRHRTLSEDRIISIKLWAESGLGCLDP